jgi:hypothetical protein
MTTRYDQLDKLLSELGARSLSVSPSQNGRTTTFYILPNGKTFLIQRPHYGDNYQIFFHSEEQNDLATLFRLAGSAKEAPADMTTPEKMSLDIPVGHVLWSQYKDAADADIAIAREWYHTLANAPKPALATVHHFVMAAYELARVAMLTAMERHLASGGQGIGEKLVQGDYSKYQPASWENRYARDQLRR